ncbi:hypothetical protein L208DRAFT_1289412 [Tricholoma matsutake]|nr:hypothetical protein L208DRAFT_1289412 [Tricholoma matsutake 945]
MQTKAAARTLIILVVSSIWLASCQAILEGRGEMGENPVLRALFFKLCHQLKTPAVFVFVFDGPCRPERVKRQDPELIEASKQLIDMFGFYCHQVSHHSVCTTAPAEAEAELSELNQLGLIDVIITEDRGAFVFGAECMI